MRDLVFYKALLLVYNTFLGLRLKMAPYEEPKHFADLIIFNCNYLMQSCVRLCNYIYSIVY